MATITRGTATVSPLGVKVAATRATGNIMHSIIGRPDPDVTFGKTALATGRIEMLFATHAAALAAAATLAAPGVYVLNMPEDSEYSMRFVVSGPLEPAVLGEGGTKWLLRVDFSEVL
jgi:hypothetical protein